MLRPWDPFAPPMVEPPPALPLARLRRLGAPSTVVDALSAWWADLGDVERRVWAAALAVTSDSELAGDWSALDDTSPASVAMWVAGHRIPSVAAKVAGEL